MAKTLSYVGNSFVLRVGFKDSPVSLRQAVALKEFADKRAKARLETLLVKRFSFSSTLSPDLDAHQRNGIRWALTRSRSYLAHAPGAGKTREAIEAAAALAALPGAVLYIVPPTATVNWQREIMKWGDVFGGWPVVTVIGDSSEQHEVNWNADILIVPHSMLTRDWVLFPLVALKKKFVAVDEASAFKEPEAQRTRALFGGQLDCGHRSPGLIRGSSHAVLLDGSPMPNGRPMEIWAPTYAMSPETIDFMGREEFGFKYCGAKQNERGNWEFRNATNMDELRGLLQKSFMHVVTEAELSHPERLRKIVWTTSDPRSSEHKEWERGQVKQIRLSDIDEKLSQGDIAHYRRELGINKAPWIARYVRERLECHNESVLLFAWHRDVVEELAIRLRKFQPGVVLGGTPEREREKYFASFQAGRLKLLILNIASGGRIHNLTRANRVVFGEFSWSDETNRQAEKRASRKGNEQAVTPCDYIAVPGSMDEVVLTSLFTKVKRTKRLVG